MFVLHPSALYLTLYTGNSFIRTEPSLELQKLSCLASNQGHNCCKFSHHECSVCRVPGRTQPLHALAHTWYDIVAVAGGGDVGPTGLHLIPITVIDCDQSDSVDLLPV